MRSDAVSYPIRMEYSTTPLQNLNMYVGANQFGSVQYAMLLSGHSRYCESKVVLRHSLISFKV